MSPPFDHATIRGRVRLDAPAPSPLSPYASLGATEER